MTVSSPVAKAVHITHSALADYSFPFKVFKAGELAVDLVDGSARVITLTPGLDYTVGGLGRDQGGTITLTQSGREKAGAELSLVLLRRMDFTQETDYRPHDVFPAETHERALDILTMICQELREMLGRAIIAPPNLDEPIQYADLVALLEAAEAARDRARDEADRAEAEADRAETARTEAQAAKTQARSSATQAKNSAALARKWAANPEDEAVQDGFYSALHYAAKAGEESSQAAASAAAARNSANAAAASADEAADAAVLAVAMSSGLATRVTTLEGQATNLEGRALALEGRGVALEGRTASLEQRVNPLEWTPWGVAITACRAARSAIIQAMELYAQSTAIAKVEAKAESLQEAIDQQATVIATVDAKHLWSRAIDNCRVTRSAFIQAMDLYKQGNEISELQEIINKQGNEILALQEVVNEQGLIITEAQTKSDWSLWNAAISAAHTARSAFIQAMELYEQSRKFDWSLWQAAISATRATRLSISQELRIWSLELIH
ncbi:MAG: hypothetical protein FWG97_01205 [Deltaproteobacteria bacterium]|nr:hypothetical protein [Deltaproteobacteria bacterium]